VVSQKLIIAPAIYGPGRTQGLPHSIRLSEDVTFEAVRGEPIVGRVLVLEQ